MRIEAKINVKFELRSSVLAHAVHTVALCFVAIGNVQLSKACCMATVQPLAAGKTIVAQCTKRKFAYMLHLGKKL